MFSSVLFGITVYAIERVSRLNLLYAIVLFCDYDDGQELKLAAFSEAR